MTESAGELFDLGYKRYEGPREGRMRARKAIFTNGVRTILGLGRSSSAKVLPIIFFVVVMAPAVVLALVASQASELNLLGHSDYYQIVSILLILFSAIIAPELLCPDRRTGVIGLYLVRPLTVTDYLAGRWLAFFSITLLLVYSGQVILLLGLTLSTESPGEYLQDNWLDVPRFLGAGFLIALFTTTLPLAVSAFTTRKAYAAAFVIGIFIISSAVAGILTHCEGRNEGATAGKGQCEPLTGDYAKWFGLIDVRGVTIHLSDLIFDVESKPEGSGRISELHNIVPISTYVVMLSGLAFMLWWRYRRITA